MDGKWQFLKILIFNILTICLGEGDPGQETIVLEMVHPPLDIDPNKTLDQVMCSSMKLPEGEPWYVTGFEPNADAVVAHHIRIWTCEPGSKTQALWSCGDRHPLHYPFGRICETREAAYLFIWAKNAGGFYLPSDVGYKVDGGSHLILDVHYKNEIGEYAGLLPGVKITMTRQKPKKLAGTFEMYLAGMKIAPGRTAFWDMLCQMREGVVPFHPFAFQVHSHHIGRVIMGYKVDKVTKEWTLIGKYDPMLPEGFYPVQADSEITINEGDVLAGRCIMVNDQDHTVALGPIRDSDEMCQFYLYYYIDEADQDKMEYDNPPKECTVFGSSKRWSKVYSNIPSEANQFEGITYTENA